MTPLSHWIGFHVALAVLLVVEFAFSRIGLKALAPEARAARQHRSAVIATVLWVAAALGFSWFVRCTISSGAATQFLAGYAIEEALSVDNLFVFLLLFRVFKVPATFQPRVLFWGVLGAIVLRGLFIAAGIGLLTRFTWVSYLFAVVLLVAAVRLVLPEDEGTPGEPERVPRWVRWVSKIHPVSLRHDRFFVAENGTHMVTMLFLCLLSIELADIIFALDSIPAVLSITRHPFIAYTSNILAVMGLRSLFFLLTAMLKRLRYLDYGLAAVLAFAALKMLAAHYFEVGALASLPVILSILAIAVAVSLLARRKAAAG